MKYRPEIDGLRALAVVPVILFHAGFKAFRGGFVGVDIFFVISGYLITTIIIAEKISGNFSLIGFYERRARRILPAMFLVMFFCVPFAWFWMIPIDLQRFSQSLVAVSVFSSNILFFLTGGYFETANEFKPLLHTWSLAVEEQYYLLFPLFLVLAWRLGNRWIIGILVLVAIISLVLAQWSSLINPEFAFFLLPARVWELLVGALVAFLLFNKDSDTTRMPKTCQAVSLIGVLLITYAVCAIDKQIPYPSLYTLIPTIGAACIIVCATQQTVVGKFLSCKLLVGIGLISYSAYLWHQPLFAFMRHRSLEEPSKLMYATLAAVAFVLAYLSWRFVETPFRNKQRFKRKQIFFYGALCSSAFITFGAVGHINVGFHYRLNDDVKRILNNGFQYRIPDGKQIINGKEYRNPQNLKCHRTGSEYLDITSSCVLGSKKLVIGALVGDSHANTLANELGAALNSQNLGVEQITFLGCPPLVNVYRVDKDISNKCPEFNQVAIDYLNNRQDYHYIILVSRWTRWLTTSGFDNLEGGREYSTDFVDIIENGVRQRNPENLRIEKIKQKIKSTVLDYLAKNKKVILVYPIPEVGWDVPVYLAKKKMFEPNAGGRDLTTSYDAYKERNKGAIETLDAIGEDKNLVRIKPEKVLCDTYVKDRCLVQLNGVALYFDHNHLSDAGAKLVAQEIIKHMLDANKADLIR